MKQKDKIDILCEARLVNVCLAESARTLLPSTFLLKN